MGASGAGKTSLLNVLSDRISKKKGASLTGRVTFNDEFEVKQNLFGNYCSYVMQDYVLFTYFTVKEALNFAATLKLSHLTKEDIASRVEELIQDLSLQHVQDIRCGSALRKTISGGERKRTALGVELITDPAVVLLDEPTSGLDSCRAESIVRLLKNLAHHKGKTIVSTIH